ncbi:MAG: macro domain-containing protein [Gluconobacter sp.]|uniref:type II toxin-antitoxin system antitoxin DNA ADP-ribosyl glycohydrolase DarG n=1 Tax=Gluconobacter sp. TaxID=1876758 RepID=UPI0039EBDB34
MLKLTQGDLLKANTQAIINTVNCVGVMGKGIALQFKQAFPANYEAYRRACEAGEVRLGEMFVFDTGSMIFPRYIINFPTKGHWKAHSRIADIASGLEDLRCVLIERRIKSVAVPPLGCGNGGLDWSNVEPLIREKLGTLDDVDVELFGPAGAPKFDEMRIATKRPNMTRGRALVLKLLGLYGAVGYRHSLLEVQKLSYFLQTAGEDLRLEFHKHHYGPYAEKLNHVLQRIDGHFIRGYGDRSKDTEIYVLEGAIEAADEFLKTDATARARLKRVTNLIEGFETPYGLELLSTVHWLAATDADASQVLEGVRCWNSRKANVMKEQHVRAAFNQLRTQGWIEARA